MDPARYDIRVYRGTAWKRIIRRRSLNGAALPVAGPCTITVRAMSADGLAATITKTITGVVDVASSEAVFAMTTSETAALPAGFYRHVTAIGQPESTGPTVVLVGDFTVEPGVA